MLCMKCLKHTQELEIIFWKGSATGNNINPKHLLRAGKLLFLAMTNFSALFFFLDNVLYEEDNSKLKITSRKRWHG